MTEAERAHLHLMESLPAERIRRHEWTPVEVKVGGRLDVAETRKINREILYLASRGLKQCEIARELDVSLTTVWRHLSGRVKSVRKK
jgi:DNA-binding NarL/FixJ family response regulator